MGVEQMLRVLRERWLVFVSVVLISVAAGLAVTARMQRTYAATAGVFVSVVLPKDPAALAGTNTFATARVQSYVNLVTTPSVTDYVVRELDLPISSSALADEITADAPLNRVLVNVRVRDASASRAATIANAVALRFTAVVADLERTEAGGSSPVRLTLVRPATEPRGPVSPRPKLDLALSLLAGVLLGVAAARLRDAVDHAVKRPRELEASSGQAVLAVLPAARPAWLAKVLGSREGLSARADRLLAANVERVLAQTGPAQTLAVTSVRPGEGKTRIALELARRLRANDRRVCLVDADLRAPEVAERLGLAAVPGLMPALRDPEQALDNVQEVGDNLFVLPAGHRPPNPHDVLALPQLKHAIDSVSRCFRYTILDTGAVEPHGDGVRASALAPSVVLVVSAAGHSRSRDVREAVAVLQAGGVRVVGTVLSNASVRDADKFIRAFNNDAPSVVPALSRG